MKAVMRYVVLAEFFDVMQGQDSFYYVKLNCGHTMRLPFKELSYKVACEECAQAGA